MRKWLFAVAALSWTLLLARGLPWVPALGPLFDVRKGIWEYEPVKLESRPLPGLKAPVTVTIDKNGVPHIFAASENDLYYAQGFLTASQRLFQMEVATRPAAGMLSELVGFQGLDLDRFMIQFGVRNASRERLKEYVKYEHAETTMQAFVDGVNFYIDTLKTPPPEYKILNQTPTKFDIGRVINMAEMLTYSLSGRSFDLHLSQINNRLGPAKMLDLFPEVLPLDDYIWKKSFNSPRAPESPSMFEFQHSFKRLPSFPFPNPSQGSNNWVVAASKSTTGTSLLANDTHLSLTLPNIWFEVQLSCPEFNVYGSALTGVPGIINGFNKDLAWGPTNGTTDVLDFYEVEFRDDKSLSYKVGEEEWKDASVVTEQIRVHGAPDQTLDTVYTDHGVIVYREGRLGLAAEWVGQRANNELRALRNLFNAKTVDECVQAFEKDWFVPIQNFVCADKRNIGWIHAGFVPRRDVGQGRTIMDGRLPGPGLKRPLPREFHPKAINPPEGFLITANQKVTAPDFPYYLGWDYEPPFRGKTIRRELEALAKVSPADMIRIQNGSFDMEAEIILPRLLQIVGTESLATHELELLAKLKTWDFEARADSIEPSLYKEWIVQLRKAYFDDDIHFDNLKLYPRDIRIAQMLSNLINDPNHSDKEWIDNRETESVEAVREVTLTAFRQSLEELGDRFGEDTAKWIWKNWTAVQFQHVARVPGFGSEVLSVNGSLESIRGVGKHHGPTYKAVVQTGEWPKAWMQIPGGMTGDPFAPNFDDHVAGWASGEMREVEFYRDVEEARARAARVIEFTPEVAP